MKGELEEERRVLGVVVADKEERWWCKALTPWLIEEIPVLLLHIFFGGGLVLSGSWAWR